MTFERREYIRYKPTAPLDAQLIWQDVNGRLKSPAQLNDLSQGGCSLISVVGPLVGNIAMVVLPLPGKTAALALSRRQLS